MHGTWAECLRESMAISGYIVGLTGGIGSGKSTVAECFSSLGVAVVDTDAIAHALTARDGRAIAAIRARLGGQFIAADGALDRGVTRERVFADANVKRQLEAILHPMIQEEVQAALQSDRVKKAPYAMLEVPLLFESPVYRDRIDATLLVDCPVATQLERVRLRSGLGADATTRIIDAQIPRAIRLQLADDVVWNGSGADKLPIQIELIHARYARNAKRVG